MAELYRQENGTDVIVGTIAVDVSSDPARFPRYGFVADFSQEKTAEKTQEEMAYLTVSYTHLKRRRVSLT